MPDIDMVEIIGLLERVNRAGYKISLRNNDLSLRTSRDTRPDHELLAEIKNNKQKLIEYFTLLDQHKTSTDSSHPLHPFNREEYPRIPLSFEQERLWFIDQWQGSHHYHVPWVLQIRGPVDTPALEHSFREIVSRHEILRTVIKEENGIGYQQIMPAGKWQLQCVDQQNILDSNSTLDAYINKLLLRAFNLSGESMLRATLIKLQEGQFILVITLHHIAFDGWSIGILAQELENLYNSRVRKTTPVLKQLPVQYADYAIWQKAHVSGKSAEAGLAYWKHRLTGVEPLNIATDFPRTGEQSTRGKVHIKKIDRKLWNKVIDLSNQERVTIFMTLLTTFNVLLYRYSGQQDICVGTPIAGRQFRELEGLIGFFINTIALRTDISGNPPFTDLLQKVKEITLGAYEHQDIPIEKVVESVAKDRMAGGNKLFQVLFVLQNTPEASDLKLENLELSEKPFIQTTSKFDISFFITEATDEVKLGIEYCTELFLPGTIAVMADHFEQLLGSIVKSPSKPVSELLMLLPLEQEQLLDTFTNTFKEFPGNRDKTIVDLIAQQAACTPEAIAIEFEGQALTYAELINRSDKLAAWLKGHGVKDEMLVPVCIEKGIDMPVALLAVLKSGAAYVPVDPDLPAERIAFIIKDTGATIVLSTREAESSIPDIEDVIVIKAEEIDDPDIETVTVNNFSPTPSQLAYVIYTSGSTGIPKGVMIEHRSLLNYCLLFKDYFSVTAADRIIQQSSLSFDTLVEEIYPALISGACVCIIREGGRDIDSIKDYIENKNATILSVTPTVLKWLNRELEITGRLRYIISGGEVLHPDCISNLFGKVEIVNSYGPSETTVCATYNRIEKLSSSSIIGKPIPNTRIYVTGKYGELNRIGVPGELCINGAGVARGYWNRPDLTKEKFIPDPFSKQKNERLYRTGDLVKWLPDGNLEYLGRIDEQVKIRGYRVEPEEIEQVLQQSGLVKQAVVAARVDKNETMRLVAYIVSENKFSSEEITRYLKNKLPDYMVPYLLLEIDQVPLLTNGKIDRKALPDPDVDQFLSQGYVAPRNEAEEKLVAIWQQLLGSERIGIHDNFFALGGHSLLATRLASAIRREMETELTIGDLFELLTIEQIANYIQFSKKDFAEFESDNMKTVRL